MRANECVETTADFWASWSLVRKALHTNQRMVVEALTKRRQLQRQKEWRIPTYLSLCGWEISSVYVLYYGCVTRRNRRGESS